MFGMKSVWHAIGRCQSGIQSINSDLNRASIRWAEADARLLAEMNARHDRLLHYLNLREARPCQPSQEKIELVRICTPEPVSSDERAREKFEAWARKEHPFLFEGDDAANAAKLVALQAWKAAIKDLAAERLP